MKTDERAEGRARRRGELILRVPRPSIRMGALQGGGIAAAIATGQVHEPTAVWALVALGVVGHGCDALLAWSGARRSGRT